MIKVQNLSKRYQQGPRVVSALDGVSFNLESGQSLAVTGSSGSGKTTLLSILSGLESCDQGEIIVAGENITGFSEKELGQFRKKNIGIVFQKFHLIPHLTAFENVNLVLEIADRKEPEQARKVLTAVGLGDRMDHLPSELSGGECQRVAIARAIVAQPKIIFADEPSGNLDSMTGESVMNLFFDLVKEQGVTLVLVTHDLSLAKRCQHNIELKHGKIL